MDLKATERSIAVAELVPQMLTAKKADGTSVKYLGDLQSKLVRFASDFGKQLVAAITAQEVDNWLRSQPVGASTRNNFRHVLVTFFSHAVSLGYAVGNPAAKASKAKEVDAPPEILTVRQAANLLENAGPQILPHVAIGLFAGLRRAEIERLDWRDVHFADNLVEVTAAKSKTARRRFVRIQPNLRAWLAPLRKSSGPVTPANFVRMFRALRTSAGLLACPSNALRHSSTSYHPAHFKDAVALALEMGHTDSGMISRIIGSSFCQRTRNAIGRSDRKRKPTARLSPSNGAADTPNDSASHLRNDSAQFSLCNLLKQFPQGKGRK